MSIKIEIEIDNLGLEQDPETGEFYPSPDMSERIVSNLLARLERDTDRSLSRVVEDKARSVADEVVREKVIELLSGPIQSTDFYGNPRGEATSIEALAMAAFDKWVRPGDSRSNYSGNNRGTMGELVEGIVKKEAEALVKPVIEGAKKQITADLIRQASEAAAAVLVGKVVRP